MIPTLPNTRVLHIDVTGHDHPGLTHSLTSILARSGARILDVGQAVIHDGLALGILIELTDEMNSSSLLTELLLKAHEIGVRIHFTAISSEEYETWVQGQAKGRYMISVLGPALEAAHLAAVSGVIAGVGLNIDRIDRLSGRTPLANDGAGRVCVELSASGELTSEDEMRSALMALTHEFDIDVAFQHDTVFRRNRRLVAFDMDSTLIGAEVIDELARRAGVFDQVAAITESAMRGELDFQASFRRRVALLKGLPASALQQVIDTVPLMDGAERLIATLRKLGYKTAILSGGFTFMGRELQRRLGIDYLHANELDVVNDVVTGEVRGEIVDAARKAHYLGEIARAEGLSMDQVIAVGDGANDLPMLRLAGLGIAFRAKPVVAGRRSAGHLDAGARRHPLPIGSARLGVRDREV